MFTALYELNQWGTRILYTTQKEKKVVWAMGDGSFQDDDVFLLLAQHICAALVEAWKPRENIYIPSIYLPVYQNLMEARVLDLVEKGGFCSRYSTSTYTAVHSDAISRYASLYCILSCHSAFGVRNKILYFRLCLARYLYAYNHIINISLIYLSNLHTATLSHLTLISQGEPTLFEQNLPVPCSLFLVSHDK